MDLHDLEQYNLKTIKEAKPSARQLPKQASYVSRAFAAGLDSIISNIIRLIVAALIGQWYLKGDIETARLYLVEHPITEHNLRIGQFLSYLYMAGVLQKIVKLIVFLFIMGGIYQIITIWRYGYTVGYRVMRIKLIDFKTLGRVSIWQVVLRHYCSLLPFCINTAIALMYLFDKINLIFFALLLLSGLWYNMGIFTKRKQSLHDFFSRTILIKF